MSATTYRLGIDIGGTFTDIVLLTDDGRVFVKKLLSTPPDYSEAIERGVEALLDEAEVDRSAVTELVHATTVATNAIIERKGVKVALVTTQGFRDVLELARFRAPRPYNLRFRKPEPLVSRELRFEVAERIGANGEVVRPLDHEQLAAVAAELRRQDVRSVALCFINAYVNDSHERAALELLADELPGFALTRSSELLPQIGEYERTSSAVINAYIRPVVGRYIDALIARIARMGIRAPLLIMQSAGGVAAGSAIAEKPIYIIESGPAAGVLGGERLAARIGLTDLIVFDMGGTTAKATIIEDGRFNICPETEVGGGVGLGQRMIKGGGYPVQVPTIDIAEVGAGGGSIAYVDDAGGLKVGPRSAGADPGPICYDRGGREPTVTDANLVLGYLNPRALVSGDVALAVDKARAAIGALAARLALDPIDAAFGIHRIANASMLRALRGVSSERGQDPARFALLAIGGNGPVHAASLAEDAGMTRIIVPPVAGLFSALGMLFADVEQQLAIGFYRRLAQTSLDELNQTVTNLVSAGRRLLDRHGYPREEDQAIRVQADIKYAGQTAPLPVTFARLPIDADVIDQLVRDFERDHQQTFGYTSKGEPVQFVALKAIMRGVSKKPRMPGAIAVPNERLSARGERAAFFGAESGWMTTPVIARADLAGGERTGPLIVEEYDSTTVVRPGWTVRLSAWNCIELCRAPATAADEESR
jgi:N-methylhydantoinase A